MKVCFQPKGEATPVKVRKREGEEEGEVQLFKRKRENSGGDTPRDSLSPDDSSWSGFSFIEESEGMERTTAGASRQPDALTDGNTLDDASNLSLPPQNTPTPVATPVPSQETIDQPKEETSSSNEIPPAPSDTPVEDTPPPLEPKQQVPSSEQPLELNNKCTEFYPPPVVSSLAVSEEPSINPIPSTPPIYKDIDYEEPQQGMLSVKKEGLFEPIDNNPPPVIPPVEEPPQDPPQLGAVPFLSPSQNTPVNPATPAAVKIEPSEESMSNERIQPVETEQVSDMSNQCNSTSPMQLTVYPCSPAESKPRHPPTQSILVPAYPPIEGDKQSQSHPSQFTPYYHPHFAPKPATPPYLVPLQNEPQNLKIKQEDPDPLQSLKEVKVPGYSPTSVSQPLLPTTTSTTTHSPHSPFVDSIKKEPEFSRISTPPKSPAVRANEAVTPQYCPPVAPPRVPHPFAPPPHPLVHHSLLSVHPFHPPPYPPFHLPFPYAPYPIPQPIPPPRPEPGLRKDMDPRDEVQEITTHHQSSTTMVHPDKQTTLAHHTSSTTQHKINKRTASPASNHNSNQVILWLF